jgi:Holliday junction DNA helicase RuvA
MITYLQGILREATPLTAIVDVQGVGYEVHIPITTAERLPRIGEPLLLYTVVVYREDSQTLYGFASKEDRDLFRTLIEKVSGIGPRTAQNILSRLSATALRNAIAQQDIALLSKCQGIGKKTAERVILELKDKLGLSLSGLATPASADSTSASSPDGISNIDLRYQDSLSALIALGYKPAEADKAIRKALQTLGEDATTEALVRTALRGS